MRTQSLLAATAFACAAAASSVDGNGNGNGPDPHVRELRPHLLQSREERVSLFVA